MNQQIRQTVKIFREVHHRQRRIMMRNLAQTGVFRSQHMTLMYLSEHEGCSQKDIAEAHNISTAAVAVNLQKLEKAGYLERCSDSNDNRRNVITITEKGRAVISHSYDIFEAMDELMFFGLEEEELQQFMQTITKMAENLKEMEQSSDVLQLYKDKKQE